MNKKILSVLLTSIMVVLPLYSQDEEIDRTVTVEREYQPTIQGAGKISVKPEVYEPEREAVDASYSNYTSPMRDIDNNSEVVLGYTETRFTQPTNNRGWIRGGVGHTATMLDFHYRMSEKKNLTFDLNAHHLGQWGRKTIAHSSLGFDLARKFTKSEFFLGVNAEEVFFTRYGRYFQYSDIDKMKGEFVDLPNYGALKKEDKNSQWEINTKIGIRSTPNSVVTYLLQTGYEAFVMKQGTVENIINTQGKLEWDRNGNRVGAELEMQNHFYKADLSEFQWSQFYKDNGDTVINNYHAIKFEPYYVYINKMFYIHAGVNLDFCLNKGRTFCPSPNLYFEAKLTKTWLAMYGGVVGDYSTSSVREHFQYLRYLHAENEIATRNNRTYNPIDAYLGFKIKPHANVLLDIYGKFNYTRYDVFYLPDKDGYFNLMGSDHNNWTIGAKVNYHYQDIVNISVGGFYNVWDMLSTADYTTGESFYDKFGLAKGHILDRPTWGLTARIDAKINSKWSVYSDNYFGGGRYALDDGQNHLAADGTHDNKIMAVKLKSTVDMNLGVQYSVDKWLSAYLQLNNILHRKHEVVYGYQTQGINFMLGVSYSF